MQADNFLLVHWQREIESLKKNISSFHADHPDVVHRLRINIKKLRAYFKLYILICNKKEDRGLFSATDNLFTILGEHRNIELNKGKAKEISGGNEDLCYAFLAWLKQEQVQFNIPLALQQFNTEGLDLLTARMKEHLGHLSNEDMQHETSKLHEHYLDKVKRHMHHFRRNSHQVRKELKVIFYLAKISLVEAVFYKHELHLLEEVLGLLGNIQDDEITLELLRRFLHQIELNHEEEILKDSITAVEMRKNELIVRAHRQAHKFLKANTAWDKELK